MKIAVPTMDEQRISAHFGHSRAFLIFEVVDHRITQRERRVNGQAGSQPAHEPHTEAEHGHHRHDHGAFAQTLGDCQVILSRGMGPGAKLALEKAGLKVVMVDEDLPIEEAVLAYAAGTLTHNERVSCQGHH
jgi:predicted Fe-Mo cluster-binding NifX family protein